MKIDFDSIKNQIEILLRDLVELRRDFGKDYKKLTQKYSKDKDNGRL